MVRKFIILALYAGLHWSGQQLKWKHKTPRLQRILLKMLKSNYRTAKRKYESPIIIIIHPFIIDR